MAAFQNLTTLKNLLLLYTENDKRWTCMLDEIIKATGNDGQLPEITNVDDFSMVPAGDIQAACIEQGFTPPAAAEVEFLRKLMHRPDAFPHIGKVRACASSVHS